MSYPRKRFGDILVMKGVVSQDKINALLARTDGREKRIGEILMAEGLITEDILAKTLAEQRDLRYIDLTDFRIQPQFFERIPVDLKDIRKGKADDLVLEEGDVVVIPETFF